ncbi:MAG: polyketide cyclase [Alphaproteobacteria bacterium]|nr:polyketide cyclase [Alphaproteobacteria bacterium]
MTNDLIYTTYIRTTPEKLWEAITNPEFTRQYWGHHNVNISDWKEGSTWSHVTLDGENIRVTGTVMESKPPVRLLLTWASPNNPTAESRVSFDISVVDDMVRLDVAHLNLDDDMAKGVTKGWPLVLSSMKSFLETGQGLNFWAGIKSGCAASA